MFLALATWGSISRRALRPLAIFWLGIPLVTSSSQTDSYPEIRIKGLVAAWAWPTSCTAMAVKPQATSCCGHGAWLASRRYEYDEMLVAGMVKWLVFQSQRRQPGAPGYGRCLAVASRIR